MHTRKGFTLLEVMIASAILAVFSAMMLSLSLTMSRAASLQEAQMTTHDEARRAMITLRKEMRHASTQSINWAALPSDTLSYQRPIDVDDNGHPLDLSGLVELGPVITVGPDWQDQNMDGERETQLVISDGQTVRVIANGLMRSEDTNENGELSEGEDTNGNGELDTGILFRRIGQTIHISIQTERRSDDRGHTISSTLQQSINPRN